MPSMPPPPPPPTMGLQQDWARKMINREKRIVRSW